jgi:hypothetical protein
MRKLSSRNRVSPAPLVENSIRFPGNLTRAEELADNVVKGVPSGGSGRRIG